MNADLKNFIAAYLRVVLMTLAPMALTAFLTIPYSLGEHIDGLTGTGASLGRHMT